MKNRTEMHEGLIELTRRCRITELNPPVIDRPRKRKIKNPRTDTGKG